MLIFLLIVIIIMLIIIACILLNNQPEKRITEEEKEIQRLKWKQITEDRYEKRLNTDKGKKRLEYEKKHPEIAKNYWKYDITLKEYTINEEMKKEKI